MPLAGRFADLEARIVRHPTATIAASPAPSRTPSSASSIGDPPSELLPLVAVKLRSMHPDVARATAFGSYEEAVAAHRWDVPERYNIAADVCDRHPRDSLAMIHEDFRRQRQARELG